jgi:hypothetical protein
MACQILSASRYSAICVAHGRFPIDEYQQLPACPGTEGVMSPAVRERFERVVAESAAANRLDRRLEVDRAREASRYRRSLAPLPWWQRVNWISIGVALLIATAWGGVIWAVASSAKGGGW